MNIKSKVIALVVLMTAALCMLLHGNNAKVHALANTTRANALKRQAEDSATIYRERVTELSRTNEELSRQVSATSYALQHAKAVNKSLEQKVRLLSADISSDMDTVQKLADCDSLNGAVRELTASNDNKDILYEQMQTDLSRQVENRDSVIDVQHDGYNALRVSFFASIARQDSMQSNYHLLEKQFNRQVVHKKILSGSLCALSALTLFSLLRR